MTSTTTYVVTVAGHLDPHWAGWLGEVALRRTDHGTTEITTEVADQAQLHGLLAGLRDLNAVLVSLSVAGTEA